MTRLSRKRYLLLGVAFMALKYAGDAALVGVWVGLAWWPLDYLRSLFPALSPKLTNEPTWLLWAMGVWTLPFIAIGVRLTMRRAIDAGWTPWIALGFFVPFANYVLMLALCIAPPKPDVITIETVGRPVEPRAAERTAVLAAAAAGALVGLAMIGVGVYNVRNYGVALFLATPYVIGVVSAYGLVRARPGATRSQASATSVLAIVLTAAMAALVAIEGAACLIMASPLALILVLLGAATGWVLGDRVRDRAAPIGLGLLLLPMAALIEPMTGPAPVAREVLTVVEIAAAPEEVWPVVVAFPRMAEPTDWLSRAGIAYPRAARIEGSGVGAVRYCEFSTGAFVEPITVWEPGRRLAFDVASSPPPMRELSFYENVKAPHLDGFLRSRRGEFRLVALPNGGTRLEGRTWYEIDMGPEWYWRLWSDWMIHRIHERVLDHIKSEVTGARR